MIQSGIWWLFLALAPAVYWLMPAAWRMAALATGSLALLAVFAGRDLLLMAALAAAVFAVWRLPALAPLRWPWPLVALLLYFFWAKYLPALADALAAGDAGAALVPLGVSYFAFKLIHYVLEMGRGGFPPHRAADFAAWLFLAPIFTAGPIERFEHFLRERQIQRFERAFLTEGVLRIAQGLVKKFVLGWLVLETLDRVTGGAGLAGLATATGSSPAATVWAALFLALVYAYLDFSAYSDIAIGSARLFGLRIMENFDLPFLARNLQGFWRRWHMTLASWCRTYVYMPMIGLTRNVYAATFVTFTVMGLWHAASLHWLFWGFWHGAGLAVLAFWSQSRPPRRIAFFRSRPWAVMAWALTMGWVALGGAFTALHGEAPVAASVRLIGMAFGVGE